MKTKITANGVDDLVEIVKAVQDGEDPRERLKQKNEKAAAAAAKEAEEKKAKRAERAKRRVPQDAAPPETAEEKMPPEGKTQRRYGEKSISREAEKVGDRILRSLHLEHLEEAPSEEAVEELLAGTHAARSPEGNALGEEEQKNGSSQGDVPEISEAEEDAPETSGAEVSEKAASVAEGVAPETVRTEETVPRKNHGKRAAQVAAAAVIVLILIVLGVLFARSGMAPEEQKEAVTEETESSVPDTEPPAVTAEKENGMIVLSASDEGEGTVSIYYAVVREEDLLQLPQYQIYESPIPYQQGSVYYFYAVDQAGNRSEPVVTTMQTAFYPAGPEDAVTITVSAIGDCTLGADRNANPSYSFDAYYTLNGASYFFENVRDILEEDDLTFANLEGPLTTSTVYQEKEYVFKGDPSYTEILTDGSVEVVTLANNHTYDYGEQGLSDTKEALDEAGIAYCTGSTVAYEEVSGITAACIGIYAPTAGADYETQVKETIAEAQRNGAQLILVSFHWGTEKATVPDSWQQDLAHLAIDCGADLVVGHHPHVLQGIEKYNGRYIVYSLANFCFGGNTAPSDQDTMIFRQTFTVDASGVAEDDAVEIIPCTVSSEAGYNNYQPTPSSGEKADAILGRVEEYSAVLGGGA